MTCSSPLRLSAFFCWRDNTSSSLTLIFLRSSIISAAKMQRKLLKYLFHVIGFIRTKFERDTYSTVQYSCRWTSAPPSFPLTVFWDSLFRLPGLWWRQKKMFVLTTYVNCIHLVQVVNTGWICFPLLIVSNLACVCFSFCIFSAAISSCWATIFNTNRRKWSDQIDSVHSFQTRKTTAFQPWPLWCLTQAGIFILFILNAFDHLIQTDPESCKHEMLDPVISHEHARCFKFFLIFL